MVEQINRSGIFERSNIMLSVSDKYDSVNECTQEISELIKLHIQGACKGKVKVNINLYSTLSGTHLQGAQVWYAFSRDLTVLPAHHAFIR